MSFVFSRFLIYFDEVARQGSIRKASEQLNVAASAINKQILQAEETLGTPLFERLPSGLRPTAAGEMLLNDTRLWRRDFERLRVQIDDLKGLRRGHVRIATIGALSQGFVPRTVTKIRREHPGIHCTLMVRDNAGVMAAVLSGDADFGLMLDPQTTRDVRVQVHAEVALGFVARPGHPLVAAGPRRFNACDGVPLIAPAPPLAIHEQWRALVAASGVIPEVAAWSDSIQMMTSLAREGLGVAVLSRLDVMEAVARGELAFAPMTDKIIKPLQLALIVAQARQLSHAAHHCLAQLENGVAQFAALPA